GASRQERVELGFFSGGERTSDRVEEIELPRSARAGDRNETRLLSEHPREADLGRGSVVFRCEGAELVDVDRVFLAGVAGEARKMSAGVFRAGRFAPAEQPAREDTEEGRADAELAEH